MNATQLFGVLAAHPYPGTTDLCLNGVGCCFMVGGVEMRYDLDGWRAQGRAIPAEWTIPSDFLSDAARVHAEIARVLALVMGAGEPDALQDRLTDEIDRRKDVEAQLAEVTAERDALVAVLTWQGAEAIYPDDLVERARRMAGDAAQHLLGREFVADARDARARLAAHLGLDGAGFAQIVEAVTRPTSTGITADALSEIASLCGVSLPATTAQTVEAVSGLLAERDSLKARLRGAEGSIETLSGLLDVLAAPVAFGERRLSPAERAEWALRRWLADGRASDTRIAQFIEAEVYLDVLGVPAYAAVPGDDPGDASEALTLPERLRLHFGGHPDRHGRSSR